MGNLGLIKLIAFKPRFPSTPVLFIRYNKCFVRLMIDA